MATVFLRVEFSLRFKQKRNETINGFSTHAGRLAAWLAVFCVPTISQGHDTWVQASARAVSPEDVVHVSLMLGNHGNHHRDFTLAGKLSSLDDATV